jgi:hypothetical protein
MKISIYKKIALSMLLSVSVLNAKVGIVDTDILIIKSEANDNAMKFGFYKDNQVINIQKEVFGVNNNTWYKTKRGFVKAKYVILESNLPEFISSDDVDYSKNALQLIVYQSTVTDSLQKLRKILKNEKYLYLEKSKNVFVIYIANLRSYSDAKLKQLEIKKYFKSAFITKIKDKRVNAKVKNYTKYSSYTPKKEIKKSLNYEVKKNYKSVSYANEYTSEVMTDAELESLQSDYIPTSISRNKPLIIKKKYEKNNYIKRTTPKVKKIVKVKTINTIPTSTRSLLEGLLLYLNTK